ncbi:MAG: hypothetical protein JSS00_06590 [Proteobacteria bacterium]|nr:hypothetical protein [Pseudomonadota bacterium]
MSHYRWNRRFYDHIDDPLGSIYMGEPALARRRRLAAEEKEYRQAREIDRTGSDKSLERAAKRLKHVKAEDRVLYVPQWDMAKAELAMRKVGVNGAVSNLCGSQVKRVQSGKQR